MTAAPFDLQADEAQALTGGRWHGIPRTVRIHGATIDSRQVRPGMAFAALSGSKVDGHDFAETAAGDGAVLIIAERQVETPVPVLLVDDVTTALGALATEFRRRYQGATWIAVAGANGKTTVKELLRAACNEHAPTHATEGNRNNHLGVPLTILSTPADCRWCVVELGANKGGEIAELAAMVQPHVGVCTGIGPAHLEGYGDLAGVARGEGAVFAAVPQGGPCIFGREGLEQVAVAAGTSAQALEQIIIDIAHGRDLLVVGSDRCPIIGEARPDGILMRCGEGEVTLPLLGRHNLANAHVAWRAAVAAGVIPELALRGLKHVKPVPGRLRLVHLQHGHRLYDDCYNANPASMYAALEELSRSHGARLAVLGAMGELGETSSALHHQIGADAARLGLPLLVVGDGPLPQALLAGYIDAGGRDHLHMDHVATALLQLHQRLGVGPTAVLVKASRAAGLDQIVHELIAAYGEDREASPQC
ncbi:MAG: UDP-N-acetylmuramoyl-tripeptide--D-alanyl-D-alanine ligase [Planctomycetota bacterium]|nr:MAG: UDP-N-acetylmuramoyl-tripeptide--D-alanyl-D-alanine ligase [Planctomycetota bacterium]